MCGIFASIATQKSFTSVDVSGLKQSLQIINHRGPDATEFKTINTSNQPGFNQDSFNIFLGHQRLSIIDLNEASNQPFTNDDNIWITFNGEIFNYIELREQLITEGYNFKTQSDTEVIINLYKKYGVDGFDKMNGMWAFVLIDKQKNKVIACRDRFSIKPLYYLINESNYYFASEIKQLLNHTNPTINKPMMAAYLSDYLIDHHPSQTFFNEIFKVPAKHFMEIDLEKNTHQFKKYWDFSNPTAYSKLDANQYSALFRNTLIDAVKIRLRSDVPVANTLSGGLDSSVIAVICNNILQQKLNNYAVISKDKKISEEEFVDELILKNNLTVTKINFDNNDSWLDVNKVIWHHDEPILSLSTIAHYKMMQQLRTQSNIKVILSGQGGDECLAGYNKYYMFNIKELLKNKKYIAAVLAITSIIPKIINGEFNFTYASRYLKTGIKKESFISKVVTIPFEKNSLGAAATLSQRQILDIEHFSVPVLNHYEDRNSMAFGLEIRLPFLDHRLVDLCVNLPNTTKINKGFTKYILRNMFTELPQKLRWRKDKKGFNIKEDTFVSEDTKARIDELFKDSLLAKHGIINLNTFQSELNNYLQNPALYWQRDIHRVIFAEIWMQTFFTSN
ncbi:MAG: Glutamine-hydrolyzing asparagine synthase [Bacteroidota bacterium]|jgi:asparagine synthase (glutamine-hydrolysing)